MDKRRADFSPYILPHLVAQIRVWDFDNGDVTECFSLFQYSTALAYLDVGAFKASGAKGI